MVDPCQRQRGLPPERPLVGLDRPGTQRTTTAPGGAIRGQPAIGGIRQARRPRHDGGADPTTPPPARGHRGHRKVYLGRLHARWGDEVSRQASPRRSPRTRLIDSAQARVWRNARHHGFLTDLGGGRRGRRHRTSSPRPGGTRQARPYGGRWAQARVPWAFFSNGAWLCSAPPCGPAPTQTVRRRSSQWLRHPELRSSCSDRVPKAVGRLTDVPAG